MNRVISVALIAMCAALNTYAQSPDAGEQRSTDQLRAIAQAIKSCKPPDFPDGVFDSLAAEGFKDVYGPPVNVVWNVELHPSIRARYVGEIDFSEPSYMQMPPTDAYCNKPKIDKKKCRERWEYGVRVQRRQEEHPLQFKYDFDVTAHGLELREVFKKDNRTDDDPWVAEDFNADVCAARAIRSVAKSASEHVEPASETSAANRPAGVPEPLWAGASIGDADAQYYLGKLYADGSGVPQDYAEAYFWFDIAVSGKVDTQPLEKIVKARDDAASRLTPTVLLQAQERARKWFDAHASK